MLDPADLAKLARPSMEDGKSEAACVEKVFQSVWGAGVGGFENGGSGLAPGRGVVRSKHVVALLSVNVDVREGPRSRPRRGQAPGRRRV
jgi:hypothetical protein